MIRSLAHVALQVTDLEASVRYAGEVLGMREVERVDGRAYLTLGSQHNTYGGCHHVIEYFEGPATALEHVAFRATDPEALQQLRNRLEKAGVPVRAGREPDIADAIRFESPCGHGFELFCGCDYSQKAYTASGVRLRRIQHVNLNASDLDAMVMVEFMNAVLGFRISDYAYSGGQLALVFLRCEADLLCATPRHPCILRRCQPVGVATQGYNRIRTAVSGQFHSFTLCGPNLQWFICEYWALLTREVTFAIWQPKGSVLGAHSRHRRDIPPSQALTACEGMVV
jgi:catechol 2,3-dioxygenase-like lactoylglutathione lyase family enzyme